MFCRNIFVQDVPIFQSAAIVYKKKKEIIQNRSKTVAKYDVITIW